MRKLVVVLGLVVIVGGAVLGFALLSGKDRAGAKHEAATPVKPQPTRQEARDGRAFSETLAKLALARGKAPGLALPTAGLTPEQRQALAREKALVPQTPEAAIAQAEQMLKDIEERLGSPADEKERATLTRQRLMVQGIIEKLRGMR